MKLTQGLFYSHPNKTIIHWHISSSENFNYLRVDVIETIHWSDRWGVIAAL